MTMNTQTDENVIVMPYKPRPLWKKILHPALKKYKRAVIVCHRRFGKTTGCVQEMIKFASKCTRRSPQVAYLAPFRNQAKLIAWKELTFQVRNIPGVKINESDLFVELPSMHKNAVGARIYIVGADNPANLRGTYWDFVVLDEYAQIKPELWDEVLVPALSDRDGRAVFIGTPKGQNAFYEIYLRAIKEPNWFAYLCTVTESGVFTEEKIEEFKREMTETAFNQEYMCDFTVSDSNILIPISLVIDAESREIPPAAVEGMPVILGVDVARFGDDKTTIWMRQGIYIPKPKVYRKLSLMETADAVIMAMREWNADMCFIDVGGLGGGVVDRIRQLGYTNITEVNFGENALDKDRFENIRCEMYYKLRDYLESGGSIPKIDDLRQELTVTEYKYAKSGRYMLIPKEDIKEKLGRSPDLADGLVLTFAKPFIKPTKFMNSFYITSEDEYDPLASY